jgi:arginyl-tRNA synthetase
MIPALLRSSSLAAASSVEAAADVDALVPTNNPAHGDYQWNFAFRIAKARRENPRALAERLLPFFAAHAGVVSAEVAGAGFVNLRLSDAWLAETLAAQSASPAAAVAQSGAGKLAIVDFSSPNVAKRMHVGHMRSTHLGHVITLLHRAAGWTVVGDNHLGDWGTPFGKLIVAWDDWRDEAAYAADPVGELERLYVLFGERTALDAGADSPERAAGCRQLNDRAREETAKLQRGDARNRALWEDFRARSLEEYEGVYARMGVAFEVVLGESEYGPITDAVVDGLLESGIAEASDGAVIVRLGDQVSVVRKKDGAATYTATDLACVRYRMDRWQPNRMVYVTDARQHQHFMNFFAVAERWGVQAEMVHMGFGMLRLPDGAMSTRKGNVIRLVDLLDEAVARARAVVDEKSSMLPEEERAAIAEAVGVGAVRYQDLVQAPTSDITFDWKKILAMEGNSAPYLLYTRARAASILRKAAADEGIPAAPQATLAHPLERELALALLRIPEAVEGALRASAPNLLAEGVYRACEAFNRFFHELKVLSEPEHRASRLALVQAADNVLVHALGLLGLRALERL